MTPKNRDEQARAEAQELRTVNLPARFSWILVGAGVMGAVATGAVLLARSTALFHHLDPVLQFWVFQLVTGLGFLLGAFTIALLSVGRTTREPVYAAMLAYAAQTVYLLAAGVLAGLGVGYFFLLLLASGAMAYVGAWMGEKITGEA